MDTVKVSFYGYKYRGVPHYQIWDRYSGGEEMPIGQIGNRTTELLRLWPEIDQIVVRRPGPENGGVGEIIGAVSGEAPFRWWVE